MLVPDGKIAMGKLSQAIAHGATLLQVDGNFDDCLTLARKLAEAYPVELVNSVNPARIEGQKTAAFEVVDALGDAPDIHCLPVGNAGNITAYWKGYVEYAGRRARRPGAGGAGRPRMWGFQAAGAAPIVLGHPVDHAGDHRHRDPDRQPGLVAAGAWRPATQSGGLIDAVDRRADPGRAPAAVGVRGRVRRAGVGGRAWRACSPCTPPAGSTRARRSSARSPATASRTRSGRCAARTAPQVAARARCRSTP